MANVKSQTTTGSLATLLKTAFYQRYWDQFVGVWDPFYAKEKPH